MNAKETVQKLLKSAGITINGSQSYDIHVQDDRFYRRVLSQPVLGLGESYMDGWWECEALDQLMERVLRAGLEKQVKGSLHFQWQVMKAKLFNLQSLGRAAKSGRYHYDKGNHLYEAMLDSGMNYSCAYWAEADNLDDAQEAKLDLICRKLELEEGMTVLDLGCGYGSFARFAAENYGAHVTGVTVSEGQYEWFQEHHDDAVPVNIEIEDYRQVEGKYDRVLSIGFFEHVGVKNYPTYMEVVDRTLKDEGISLIHTIGSNESMVVINPWTARYIFPNSMLPSVSQIGESIEEYFVMEDWHNFGPDYDKTLMQWHANFENAWSELKEKYSERFHRMWRYYLLTSAAGFRSRQSQLWQVVLTKPGREQPFVRYR